MEAPAQILPFLGIEFDSQSGATVDGGKAGSPHLRVTKLAEQEVLHQAPATVFDS